jgi:hypothetical protein
VGAGLFVSKFTPYWALLSFNVVMVLLSTVSFFVLYFIILPSFKSYSQLGENEFQCNDINAEDKEKSERGLDGQELSVETNSSP